jgi:hypothetical protein
MRAAERVARFTSGHGFDDYLSNERLRSGVERDLPALLTALKRMLGDIER